MLYCKTFKLIITGFLISSANFVKMFIIGACFLHLELRWREAIYQVALLGGADRMDKRGQSQCVSYTCTSHGGEEGLWGVVPC